MNSYFSKTFKPCFTYVDYTFNVHFNFKLLLYNNNKLIGSSYLNKLFSAATELATIDVQLEGEQADRGCS